MPAIPLEQALSERVLLFNAAPMNPAWGAESYAVEFNLTHPGALLEWNRGLVEAGAEVIDTHTHNLEPISDGGRAAKCNRAAVAITRKAAGERAYVLGTVGPSLVPLSLAPDRRIEDTLASHAAQIRELWSAGVDAIHLTFQLDSRSLEAGLLAVELVQQETGTRIPTIITFDIEPFGTLTSGEKPADLWQLIQPHRPIALALAAYGRGQENVRALRDVSGLPVGFLVDPFHQNPHEPHRPIEWVEEALRPLLAEGLLSFCGISCTMPSLGYVRAVAGLIGDTCREAQAYRGSLT